MRTGGAGPRSLPRAGDQASRNADLEALLTAVARGDQAAFEAVCTAVAPAVFGIARGVIRDRCQAEEVCQEVLLEVWLGAPRFQPGKGSAMAWVTTIAHRRAVDRVRAEQRAVSRLHRAAVHEIDHDVVAEQAGARLDRERVRRCLGSLTELQHQAVTLAYYRGYTYREVATLLGVPEGTVKTRMRDGLIRLRDCLGTR